MNNIESRIKRLEQQAETGETAFLVCASVLDAPEELRNKWPVYETLTRKLYASGEALVEPYSDCRRVVRFDMVTLPLAEWQAHAETQGIPLPQDMVDFLRQKESAHPE
jgi:hypothetical protein